jgi:hypothetical protein
LSWGLMVLLAFIFLSGCGKTNVGNQHNLDVLAVLHKFQAGYSKRDVSKIDEYVRDIFDPEDVLIIGTGASKLGEGEW